MDETTGKNASVHISSKSHLNLTFNLYQCGNREVMTGGRISIAANDIFNLIYINKGAALLEFNGLAFKLCSAQGFFAFPDVQYDLQSIGDETLDIVWLSFSGYLVENYLNRANIYRTRPFFSDCDSQVGEKINQIYVASQKMPNRYCRMMSILYDLFSYLLDVNPTKQEKYYTDSVDFFVVKATDYIERNFAKNISVDEIADVVGISRKHLYAIFSRVLKISPKQYLIYYRIEKACMRLKATSNSIFEISESVGYTNQFYFSKEFKRLTGLTPSEYRKNPNLSEVFSLSAFMPTLREKFEIQNIDLVMTEEPVFTVFGPVQEQY